MLFFIKVGILQGVEVIPDYIPMHFSATVNKDIECFARILKGCWLFGQPTLSISYSIVISFLCSENPLSILQWRIHISQLCQSLKWLYARLYAPCVQPFVFQKECFWIRFVLPQWICIFFLLWLPNLVPSYQRLQMFLLAIYKRLVGLCLHPCCFQRIC